MVKIEIGAGFVLTAIAGFDLLHNAVANVLLLAIGVLLVIHGAYDVFLKPRVFWKRRIIKWLQSRGWKVKLDLNPKFTFVVLATDEGNHEVAITRGLTNGSLIVFSSKIQLEQGWIESLERLNDSNRKQLLEDIRIYFTSKNMGFAAVEWPLSNLAIQQALALDNTSEHSVDLKAKEVVLTAIGVRSIVRKAIALSTPEIKGSRN